MNSFFVLADDDAAATAAAVETTHAVTPPAKRYPNKKDSSSSHVSCDVADRGSSMAYSTTTIKSSLSPSSSSSSIITLNVGGKLFTTTKSTLTSHKGTFLEALASGRHDHPALSLMEDGGNNEATNNINNSSCITYFIDRDPDHFKHILNFFRTGTVISLPHTEAGKRELLVEADFYGLDAMVKAMQSPVVDVNDFLPADVVLEHDKEKELRSAFVRGERMSPHRGLIPLFSDDHGLNCPLLFDPESPLRNPSYLFLKNVRTDVKPAAIDASTPVTVKSLVEFTTNFNKEFPNVLHRLNDVLRYENVIIAGGSVLRALTGDEKVRTGGKWWGQTSDIDLFLYDVDNNEAERIVRRVVYALAIDAEGWVIVRAPRTINIHCDKRIKIQIVLRIYDSPAEVLLGFDVDCVCCCYDGREVWITPRCEYSLRSGVNVLNPLHAWPRKASYELRLGKYACRGFAVFVPGIDKTRVDDDLINNESLKDLKGLGRFLKVVLEMEPSMPTTEWWNGTRLELEREPLPLRRLAGLKEEIIRTSTPDEILVDTFEWNWYDDDYPENLLVPSVYEHPGYAYFDFDFQASSTTRDAALETIVNCNEESGENIPPTVPRLLADAWERGKRSREYMNDELDQIDRDTLYFAGGYRTHSSSITDDES